jgi:hypothetical protein
MRSRAEQLTKAVQNIVIQDQLLKLGFDYEEIIALIDNLKDFSAVVRSVFPWLYRTRVVCELPRRSNSCSWTTPDPQPLLSVAVLVNGQPAYVGFWGEAPSLVSGAMQINVQIPANPPTGNLPLHFGACEKLPAAALQN